MLRVDPAPHSHAAAGAKPQQQVAEAPAGRAGSGGSTTLADRLGSVALRYLADWHGTVEGGPAGQQGPLEAAMTDQEVERHVSMYMAPSVTFHPDAAIYPKPLTGVSGYVAARRVERAAYRSLDWRPLAVAAHAEDDVAFVLSSWRVQSVGPWRGQPATGMVSEGIQVDEIHFDPEAKIQDVWVHRQMTQEERSALLTDESTHHAPAFDPSLLLRAPHTQHHGHHAAHAAQAPGQGAAGASPPAADKMLRCAHLWAEAWNVASASGSLNPDMLDNLLGPGFQLHDCLGLAGDSGQDHPYAAMRSRDDAKAVLQQMTQRYDIDEATASVAAAPGTNVAFLRWRARLMPKASGSSAGAGDASETATGGGGTAQRPQVVTETSVLGPGGGGRMAGSGIGGAFMVEATEVLLFDASCAIIAIYQFRRPMGHDRRAVLSSEAVKGAAGEPAGAAEAMAEAMADLMGAE